MMTVLAVPKSTANFLVSEKKPILYLSKKLVSKVAMTGSHHGHTVLIAIAYALLIAY